METEPNIINDYVRAGKVKLVYRHLVQIGEGSQLTGEASECAADQGRLWEMRYAIYEQQDRFYGNDVRTASVSLAGELGLDTVAFQACMDQGKYRAAVQADHAAATAAGVRSRPVFDLNNQRLIGALSYQRFQALMDAALQ